MLLKIRKTPTKAFILSAVLVMCMSGLTQAASGIAASKNHEMKPTVHIDGLKASYVTGSKPFVQMTIHSKQKTSCDVVVINQQTKKVYRITKDITKAGPGVKSYKFFLPTEKASSYNLSIQVKPMEAKNSSISLSRKYTVVNESSQKTDASKGAAKGKSKKISKESSNGMQKKNPKDSKKKAIKAGLVQIAGETQKPSSKAAARPARLSTSEANVKASSLPTPTSTPGAVKQEPVVYEYQDPTRRFTAKITLVGGDLTAALSGDQHISQTPVTIVIVDKVSHNAYMDQSTIESGQAIFRTVLDPGSYSGMISFTDAEGNKVNIDITTFQIQ